MEVLVMQKLLAANDAVAEENRRFFRDHNLYVINLMGSPGSGKTTLISALAERLGRPVGVIEGDISSSIDAERLEKQGVHEGAQKLGMRDAVRFIENVGNLICPAEFDLGENYRLLAASVPEGDDKPYKYVPMFSYVNGVALTKSDLMEAVGFDSANFRRGLAALSKAPVWEVSCRTGTGVDELAAALRGQWEPAR